MALTLTTDERSELERRLRSPKIRAEDARRARVILMLAESESVISMTAALGWLFGSHQSVESSASKRTASWACARSIEARRRACAPAMEMRILAKARQKAPTGAHIGLRANSRSCCCQ
jgi:hypothetical protein